MTETVKKYYKTNRNTVLWEDHEIEMLRNLEDKEFIIKNSLTLVEEKAYTEVCAERDALLEKNKALQAQVDVLSYRTPSDLMKQNADLAAELSRVKKALDATKRALCNFAGEIVAEEQARMEEV